MKKISKLLKALSICILEINSDMRNSNKIYRANENICKSFRELDFSSIKMRQMSRKILIIPTQYSNRCVALMVATSCTFNIKKYEMHPALMQHTLMTNGFIGCTHGGHILYSCCGKFLKRIQTLIRIFLGIYLFFSGFCSILQS